MEEYVHTTRMSSLAAKANNIFWLTKGHNSKTEKSGTVRNQTMVPGRCA